MLSRSTRHLIKNCTSILKNASKKQTIPLIQINKVRFNSTFNNGKASTTNLFDDSDPSRDHMFQYSWGTWLKNDKLEKSKRYTKFSIQGLNDLVKRIDNIEKLAKPKGKDGNQDEIKVIENSKILSNNIEYFFKDQQVGNIRQIISLHEGKHHRVYTVSIEGVEKKFILRLPYSLESKLFTKRKIESEVATMDFLTNALNLNIPRVLSYSGDFNNFIGHPYILMECVEDVESSLMKNWNPLIDSAENRLNDGVAMDKLNEVIEPISDFNKIVGDFIFDNYGSLYFKDDLPENLRAVAYEGQDRWFIGPTVETAYYRNKELLEEDELDKFVGPWKSSEPLKMVEDLVSLELKNLKLKLEFTRDGKLPSTDEVNEQDLETAIKIFEKASRVSGELFNLNESETLIPNLNDLLKPRLQIGDLDPMNVLVKKDNKGFAFFDFENSVIKPFLISSYPKFIEYNGAKIFNLQEEIPNFEELDDIEKEQYKFMFKRTRNQFFWEVTINKNSKELVGVISPVIKLIKNSYLNILNFKKLKDSLYVENGLIEISTMWENYNSNGVLGKFKGEDNPIKFSEEEIKEFGEAIKNYEIETSTKPFVATNGWVPQDMFRNLQEQGMIIRNDETDEWTIDTEKILQ